MFDNNLLPSTMMMITACLANIIQRAHLFYSLRKEIEVQERAAADASLGDAKQTTTGSTRHRCNGLLVLLLAVGPPQLENPRGGNSLTFSQWSSSSYFFFKQTWFLKEKKTVN